jgi:hypothetical protein
MSDLKTVQFLSSVENIAIAAMAVVTMSAVVARFSIFCWQWVTRSLKREGVK